MALELRIKTPLSKRIEGYGLKIPGENQTMSHRRILLAILACLLILCVPTMAHHSFAAQFDAKKPVTLQGTVTQMEWINPHAWIHMDVKGADGKTVSWMVEMGSPNILLRRGIDKKTLEPGTTIIVQGYLAKDGENKVNGGSVTFKDGRKLFVGGSNPSELPQSSK